MPEELEPGDLLPWGVIHEKTWGGPIGIDAWRVVVSDQHRPVWLKPRRTVICRRAVAPRESMTSVSGVVSSGPARRRRAV